MESRKKRYTKLWCKHIEKRLNPDSPRSNDDLKKLREAAMRKELEAAARDIERRYRGSSNRRMLSGVSTLRKKERGAGGASLRSSVGFGRGGGGGFAEREGRKSVVEERGYGAATDERWCRDREYRFKPRQRPPLSANQRSHFSANQRSHFNETPSAVPQRLNSNGINTQHDDYGDKGMTFRTGSAPPSSNTNARSTEHHVSKQEERQMPSRTQQWGRRDDEAVNRNEGESSGNEVTMEVELDQPQQRPSTSSSEQKEKRTQVKGENEDGEEEDESAGAEEEEDDDNTKDEHEGVELKQAKDKRKDCYLLTVHPTVESKRVINVEPIIEGIRRWMEIREGREGALRKEGAPGKKRGRQDDGDGEGGGKETGGAKNTEKGDGIEDGNVPPRLTLKEHLQILLDILNQCKTPQLRGLNKSAEFASSVLECDGLGCFHSIMNDKSG